MLLHRVILDVYSHCEPDYAPSLGVVLRIRLRHRLSVRVATVDGEVARGATEGGW